MRESLRRKAKEAPKRKAKEAKDCLKKKAKEAPKQKSKEAQDCLKKAKEAPKQKTEEAINLVELTDDQKYTYYEEMRRGCEVTARLKRADFVKSVKEIIRNGYVFCPEEWKLLDFLRNKIMNKPMDFCPIKEVNVYANHPQALTGISDVWYFLTHSRPNEIQPGSAVEGNWIIGEKNDVFYQDAKVGVKQVVEYCEVGHKSEYKIIEYQLDPVPDNMKAGLWFVCKLYIDGRCADVRSGS